MAIQKANLVALLREYEKERSPWKVGFFAPVIDMFTGSNGIYCTVKNFVDYQLNDKKDSYTLTDSEIKVLGALVAKVYAGPNSWNGAIVDFSEKLEELLRTNSPSKTS